MNTGETTLSMKTKCYCVLGVLSMCSKSEKIRAGEVIISKRKIGDIEKGYLPGAPVLDTGKQ